MLTLTFFFVLGLIIGSFLNVVVLRLKKGQSFASGRSVCPKCGKTIRWFDNIPVLSFFILGGRCRRCRKKISWQYPLVEFSTGVVFSLVAFLFFNPADPLSWILTFYYLIISAALISILIYDWLFMEVPMNIVWLAIGVSVFFNLYLDAAVYLGFFENFPAGLSFGLFENRIYAGMLGSFLAFLFFFSLSYFSREKWMGMGDSYIAALIGLFLGWPGTILAVFLSFLLGSFYGIIMIVVKRKDMKSRVPFGPFLVSGAFLSLFWYEPITVWYWSLF